MYVEAFSARWQIQFSHVPMPTFHWSQHQYPRNQATETTTSNSQITLGRPTSPNGSSNACEPVIVSASVKIICPNEKQSEHRVFVLRDLDVSDISMGMKFIPNLVMNSLIKSQSLTLVTSTVANEYGYEMMRI